MYHAEFLAEELQSFEYLLDLCRYTIIRGNTKQNKKSGFRCKNTIFLKVFDEQFSKL